MTSPARVDEEGRRELAAGVDRVRRSPCPDRGSSGTATGAPRGTVAPVSGPSSESRPRNATSSSRSIACAWKNGNSSRQGPHHDAHLLTTTGVPSSSASRASKPSRPSSRISFACSRSATSSGGASSSGAWASSSGQLGLRRCSRIALVVIAADRTRRARRAPSPTRTPGCLNSLLESSSAASGWYFSGGSRTGTAGAPARQRGKPRRPPPRAYIARLRALCAQAGTSRKAFRWQTPLTLPLARHALPRKPTSSARRQFTREPILLEGRDARGPRARERRACSRSRTRVAELDAGAEEPSTEWRREYSLVLGLERVPLDGAADAPRRRRAERAPGGRPLGHARRADHRGRGGQEPERQGKRGNGAAERAGRPPSPTRPRTATVNGRGRPRRGARARRGAAGLGGRGRRRGRGGGRRGARGPGREHGASGSSTRPAPARPSPPSASSRRLAPAAS